MLHLSLSVCFDDILDICRSQLETALINEVDSLLRVVYGREIIGRTRE